MKTVGIIAEYNPFHNGHHYQIQFSKDKLQADYIIIAMSGDFVQRGTPAILSKHTRTEMALRGGADLVLELPVSISTSSAEFFAAGGVNLLDSLGVVNTLCFGCENNIPLLFNETARILIEEPVNFRVELQNELKKGKSFPSARSQALLKYFTEQYTDTSNSNEISQILRRESITDFVNSPNNILGIEYCKAILRQKSPITPYPLKREGAEYHELTLKNQTFPSASGIRHLLQNSLLENTICVDPTYTEQQDLPLTQTLKTMIPEDAVSPFVADFIQNRSVTEHHLDLLLHYRLLEETFDSLRNYLDVNEELARRIINSRNMYQGFTQFTEILKTKELTYTRIQRALIHILLKIYEVPATVPFARVLGFRKSASPLLKEIKKNARIPFITKLANSNDLLSEEGLRVLEENTFASNLYESLIQQQTHGTFCHEYTKPVVII